MVLRGLRGRSVETGRGKKFGGGVIALTCGLLLVAGGELCAQAPPLGPQDVLLLVNADSPVSRAVAEIYRHYHPEIQDWQVLELSGLPDSASPTAGPAQEILTREQYETLIAEPLRNYLVSNGLVDSVYCLITTAGMPYRIKDTAPDLANVVYPAGSAATLTVNNIGRVDAASVESELAVLFQTDPALPSASRLLLRNRLVNPYQGYRSPIKSWSAVRDILGRRSTFRYTGMWTIRTTPWIEGDYDDEGYTARNRRMSAADIYLVARLDGPHRQGQCAFFAVRRMLERAARVSNPAHPRFVGYNGFQSFVAIDDVPSCTSGCPFPYARTPVYNLRPGLDVLTCASHPTPPGAEWGQIGFCDMNHFEQVFGRLAGYGPPLNVQFKTRAYTGVMETILWDDTNSLPTQADAPYSTKAISAFFTYGRNAGDGRPANYLMVNGPGGGPLFQCAPGAVFASLESFNAVTMFLSTATTQAKIAEFIEIGGSGAIGHAFEPEGSGIAQVDYLALGMFQDEDWDAAGDLTWVEAAFTAMPFLSWTDVVIGDPLMRLVRGAGGVAGGETFEPDITHDGVMNGADYGRLACAYGTVFGEEGYDPMADLNEDGRVDGIDYGILASFFGTGF